jgi:hypothetical protein
MANQQDGFARGVRVCAKMLDSLIDIDMDEFVIDGSRYRDGRPKDNAARRVLGQTLKLLKRGDAAEFDGFCAELTEACARADQRGDCSREFTKFVKQRALEAANREVAHG